VVVWVVWALSSRIWCLHFLMPAAAGAIYMTFSFPYTFLPSIPSPPSLPFRSSHARKTLRTPTVKPRTSS
jgi:hypothetical protein